jgi:hypothetical protein
MIIQQSAPLRNFKCYAALGCLAITYFTTRDDAFVYLFQHVKDIFRLRKLRKESAKLAGFLSPFYISPLVLTRREILP